MIDLEKLSKQIKQEKTLDTLELKVGELHKAQTVKEKIRCIADVQMACAGLYVAYPKTAKYMSDLVLCDYPESYIPFIERELRKIFNPKFERGGRE